MKAKRVRPEARLPEKGRRGDAGWDLFSTVSCVIGPGERAKIPTGVAVALKPNEVGIIKGRSGHADNFGINPLGGVIDSNYRGEIFVILHNTGLRSFHIQAATGVKEDTKIAQMVVHDCSPDDDLEIVDDFDDVTERGEAGFNSSGG